MQFTTLIGISFFLVFCGACNDYPPTTKFAAFGDIFTVTFDTCNGCCGAGAQWIWNATIMFNETYGKVLPWDNSQGRFWVTFAPENTTIGNNQYRLSYEYDCDPVDPCLSCACLQQDILLQLRIANFSLERTEARLQIGKNVELLSSSGLEDNNVTVQFVYYDSLQLYQEGVESTRNATCEPNMIEPKYVGDWKIIRSSSPPYDCRLVILNATAEDSGFYEAVGLLPNGDGGYEYASSNIVMLEFVEELTLEPSKYTSEITILVISLVATFVGIIILLFAFAFFLRRRRNDGRRYQQLPREQYARTGRPVHQPDIAAGGYGGVQEGRGGEGEVIGGGRRRGDTGVPEPPQPGFVSPNLSVSVSTDRQTPASLPPSIMCGRADRPSGEREGTITPLIRSTSGEYIEEDTTATIFSGSPSSDITVVPTGRGRAIPSPRHTDTPVTDPVTLPPLSEVGRPGLGGAFDDTLRADLQVSLVSDGSDISSMSMFSEPKRESPDSQGSSKDGSDDRASIATGQGSPDVSGGVLIPRPRGPGSVTSVATGVPTPSPRDPGLTAFTGSSPAISPATGVPSETSSLHNGNHGSNGSTSPVESESTAALASSLNEEHSTNDGKS